MNNIARKTFFLLAILGFGIFSMANAQTDEDIAGFLKYGQKCYNSGDLSGAAIEFENILLIDRKNFEAQIWLAQVYADMKEIDKAKKVLREASIQAPDHPKVIQLTQILGGEGDVKNKVQSDLVLYEALTLLGSGTRLRKYGLVIPEAKVVPDKTEEKMLVFDDVEIKVEKKEEKEIDLLALEENDGPLSEVFKLWDGNGLTAGLDKYFELLLNDPGLAAQDDRGLLQKGEEFFATRFENHKDDEEARYYSGMLFYVNGMFKEAEFTLKYFAEKPGKFGPRLTKVFKTLKEWRQQEEERLAAIKRAEEERLAAELRAKQEAEEAARNKDVFDEIKKQTEGEKPKAGSINAEARAFHDKGFDLYKKGRLDEAILQFEQAILKDDKDSQTYYHMGLAYTDKGLAGNTESFDRAITAFKRVVALSPTGKMAKDAESMIRDIEAAKASLGGGSL